MIGTNPIAFSVPDGEGGVAMQFDQSTTTVALGKITMANAAGEAIPEGWAIDAEGRPTCPEHVTGALTPERLERICRGYRRVLQAEGEVDPDDPDLQRLRDHEREIDIPIFSWGTLLDYAYSVAVHREYYGHV